MKKANETGLVRTCLEYLIRTGWKAWRNNTGATKAQYNGKTRLIRFSVKGAGDIFAVRDGIFLSLETKMPGKNPTPDQAEWIRDVNMHGGTAAVIRSLDDLIALVKGLDA